MVAVTVDLAKYRAIVHYTDCSYYKTNHTHVNLEIPPSVKWKLCSFCTPKREDIASIAHDIRWVYKNADAMSFRFMTLEDENEDHVVKMSANGRRKVRTAMRFGER